MKEKRRSFKYGKPISQTDAPKPRRRLPQYDECLREFVQSGHGNWEVDVKSLPGRDPRVVLSSLKWRTRKKPEFKGIQVVMYKGRVFLEKVKSDGRDKADSHQSHSNRRESARKQFR